MDEARIKEIGTILTEETDFSELPIVVGLGHTAQVGKDTAALALIDNLGFERISIADMIRELILEINPLVDSGARLGDYLELFTDSGHSQAHAYESLKRSSPEIRRLLQETGRAVREVIGETAWVDALACKLHESTHDRFVMTDVRYPSEVELVKRFDGPVIKIFRPGVEPLDHETDRALRDFEYWDATLLNAGTVLEIQDELLETVATYYEEGP